MDAAEIFARHHRIGFQFSGGRDSTAALFLLEPLWPRMDVYHLDTLDQFPEVARVVAEVERHVKITRIYSDAHAVRLQHGLPSDVVPFDNTTVGRVLSGRKLHIQSKMDCCWRTLMEPLHRRMREDHITLIVRGQRDDEFLGDHPIRSGHIENGQELYYPIQSWSAADVDRYIAERGLPVAPFYAHGAKQAPECMGCTAWWGEGRLPYMAAYHPKKHGEVALQIHMIRVEIGRQMNQLNEE